MSADRRDRLQLLEDEDRHVLELLVRIERTRGQGVEARDRYGILAKALIRALGSREAAVVAVLDGLERAEVLEPVAERFRENLSERRRAIDTVEQMGRGVPGTELRRGQDFDDELRHLRDAMTDQIEWELKVAIPSVRARVSPGRAGQAVLERPLPPPARADQPRPEAAPMARAGTGGLPPDVDRDPAARLPDRGAPGALSPRLRPTRSRRARGPCRRGPRP